MSKNNKWTEEQLAFLVVCRTKKQTWENIAFSMEEKFGIWRSPANIGTKYRNLFDVDFAKEFTPEQIEFITGCYLNHFSMKKILNGYNEQFGHKINKSNIDEVVKRHLATEKKVEVEIKTIKTKIKERKKMKTKRTALKWSKKEDEMIMACKSRKEAFALPLQSRTESAIRNRWQKLKGESKAVKPEQKTVKKKKIHGNNGRKYTPRWTKEQDYDLILNFYELSIDEARNRFNRPYGVIASRLEKLVDSTKPEHISMLVEASKEIKSRKKAQNPTPKKSRRTLRKERKKAKKEAKLKAKLQKIRGE